ncbi:MAG: enamine deaminase RidA (YjgF/YER057c/UK114 family) [Ilumatobacter sp.]
MIDAAPFAGQWHTPLMTTRQNISSGGPYEVLYGYSRAVKVGNQVHVAGTCAQPPNVDGVGAYSQAVDALNTISVALIEAGASMADVVRTRIYVIDINDTDDVLRAHGEVFGATRPACTLVQVAGLIDPNLLVEIEAYAVVSD